MSVQLIDCNYLIHNEIGGGKSLGLPSLGLDTQRFPVRDRRMGSRFSYTSASASPCNVMEGVV